METKPVLNTILLHVCCGVCAGWPVQKLREDGHVPVGYFYNPNIHPEDEYLKRLAAAREISKALEFELIEGYYDPARWLEAVKGLEDEKEGGKRCEVCFRMRLEETGRKAKELGISNFTTTLSVSPQKSSKKINDAGKSVHPKAFTECDFKKDDGNKKTRNLAKRFQLYCQDYCGCRFSKSRACSSIG
ncbi:MAG: epoxyqueuosine reductase QueH [Candidatus Saganbacteria bacterium]|nr:epoxyqueuosine reductase QueH [Candidatus Saganbacteria bacterium]